MRPSSSERLEVPRLTDDSEKNAAPCAFRFKGPKEKVITMKKTDDYKILCNAAARLKDLPEGVCNPWPDYDPSVVAALDTLNDYDYLQHHEQLEGKAIESMNIKEIATMYTFIRRGERFSDGHIGAYIEDGTLYRLILRHIELLEKKRRLRIFRN